MSVDNDAKKKIGDIGEQNVKLELDKLDKVNFKVLNDIFIKPYDKRTKQYYGAQIDHIVISKKVIYLIETKNWSGKVYGDQYSKNWIKYLGKDKLVTYNVAKQVWYHKKNFLKLFKDDIKDMEVKSIIVFDTLAKIDNLSVETTSLKIDELVSFIDGYDKRENYKLDGKKSYELDGEELRILESKIKEKNIVCKKQRLEYIQKIKERCEFEKIEYKTPISNKMQEVKENTYIEKENIYDNKLSNYNEKKNNNYKKKFSNSKEYKNNNITACDIKRRVHAYLIDSIMDMIFYGTGHYILSKGNIPIKTIIIYILINLYFISKSKSFGKYMMEIKVVDSQSGNNLNLKSMLKREILVKPIISCFTMGIGTLMAFVTKDNKTMYDKILKTMVVDDK